jgi:LacI family transcriptional regulator
MIGPTNIRALAKELNLSIGTVSKALRDSHEISVETKEKVFALAKKRSYTPKPYASSLRRKKSNTIGVVIPEVADSFFSHAIKGIEAIAQSKGYHVLVYLTYESFAKEQAILKAFNSGRVDGVLLSVSSETRNNKHILDLASKEIPVVFFDRVSDDVSTARVSTNDFESCYAATQLLIRKGCRRIAYLSISKHLSINAKRIEGFKRALELNDIKESHSDIIHCSNDNEKN